MSTDSNGSAQPTVIEGGLRTSVLEAGAEGFWEWNVSTGAVAFSKSCRIRLGYAPDEIGDHAADWKKFMHPDDLAAARKSVEDHLQGNTDSCEFELRLKCRDGSWRWMLARGQVIERTPEGRPRKVFGTHFDITGWREAQEKIDEQNRFLGTLVGNLPGMVYVCRNDPQWTITFVSEGCRSVTGYEPADLLLNRTISYGDLVHPDDRDALWKKCQESLAQRIPCINQYRIINKAGNIRWVAERAVGVYSPDGTLLTIEGFVQEVTAQRSAEMERAKTEERLRQAVIASRMVWWEWDLSGNGLRVHACGTPCILGYDSIDLLKETGATWMEKVHPEERDAVARSLADTIEGRTQTWSVTHRLRAKNGSWQWVEQNGRATQRDGNDRALWMAGTTRDVHDSVEAQLEKRLSAERLLESQRIAHLGNWTMGVDRPDEGWCSEELYRILGIVSTFPGFTRAQFALLVHPEDAARLRTTIESVIAYNRRATLDYRIIRPDGEERHLRDMIVPDLGRNARVGRIRGVVQDITDQVVSAWALNLAHEQRRLAIESARLGTWKYDLVQKISEWDPRMAELHGFEQSPTWEEYLHCIHPDDHEAVIDAWKEVVAGKGPFRVDYRALRQDGGITHLHSEGNVFCGSNGKPLWSAGVVRDVTGEKEAQEQARNLERKSQQAQRLETLGHFAGGVAHDFNNLLTGILGSLELVEMDLADGRDPDDLLKTARNAALRAQELVKRLLLFSRGEKTGANVPLDLGKLITETARLLRVTLPKSTSLVFDLPSECPLVVADEGQIMQVLMNLCVNSSHAIGDRPGEIRIALAGVENGAGVRLSVSDNGSGMDQETLQRIFLPFFTTKTPGKGTGFGLAIVHGILRQLGASVSVESTVGEGTTFSIQFPAAVENPPPVISAAAPPTKDLGSRILVVDDEPVVLKFMTAALRSAGHSPTPKDSPEEALSLIKSDPDAVDFLITDLAMPNVNGYELIKRARSFKPDLPAIIMSGDFGRFPRPDPDLSEVKRLEKPIHLAELLKALPHRVR